MRKTIPDVISMKEKDWIKNYDQEVFSYLNFNLENEWEILINPFNPYINNYHNFILINNEFINYIKLLK